MYPTLVTIRREVNTQETPDSSAGGHIHRLAVRLPPFWPDRPASGSPKPKLNDVHHRAPSTSGKTAATGVDGGRRLFLNFQPPIQQLNGILCKKRRNTIPHRPTTHRSRSNSRRFSGQSAAQSGLTRLQPQRISPRLAGQQAAQTDSLVCSLAGQQAAQADSLAAAPPDPCATPDN